MAHLVGQLAGNHCTRLSHIEPRHVSVRPEVSRFHAKVCESFDPSVFGVLILKQVASTFEFRKSTLPGIVRSSSEEWTRFYHHRTIRKKGLVGSVIQNVVKCGEVVHFRSVNACAPPSRKMMCNCGERNG